ncbi:MAG: hypothetical protein ACJ75B_09345 [Flavisolibacter sp.]|jgi:hypothetical protein
MKSLVLIFLYLLMSTVVRANSLSGQIDNHLRDSLPKKLSIKPNKNEKLYCSDYAKSKYKILISGSKIKITRLYKEYVESFSGTIKNGKIYSNNPDEITVKDIKGKYYKFQDSYFGVLNIENGDYEWFSLCKN